MMKLTWPRLNVAVMMNIDEAGDEYLCVEAAVVAKSSIVLDVKPWDDETDMAEIERCVRSVETDGLLWGNCELLTYFPVT